MKKIREGLRFHGKGGKPSENDKNEDSKAIPHETTETESTLSGKNVDGKYDVLKVWVEEVKETSGNTPRELEFKNRGNCLELCMEVAEYYQKKLPSEVISYYYRTYESYKTMNDNMTPVIALVGETGTGKSTFGNLLLNGPSSREKTFETGSAASLCTQEMKKEDGHWFGDVSEKQIRVVDFPGFNNVWDKEITNLPPWIEKYHDLAYITTLCFVFNGGNARFSEAHRQMIDVCRGCFGVDVFNNVALVFTHWFTDETSQRSRQAEGNSKEHKTKHYTDIFRRELGTEEDVKFPCFFVDSLGMIISGEDSTECADERRKFRTTVEGMSPFKVFKIKSRIKYFEKYEQGLQQWISRTKETPNRSAGTQMRAEDDGPEPKRKGNKHQKEAKAHTKKLLRDHLKQLDSVLSKQQKQAYKDVSQQEKKEELPLYKTSCVYQVAEKICFSKSIDKAEKTTSV